jgi:hypothetical protein
MATRSNPVPLVEGAEIGPGGGTLIFENERVRVWDMRFEPGERTKLHTHALDFMLVQIEGDRIAVEPHPETAGSQTEFAEVDVRPGDFYYLERGGVETAFNAGQKSWRELCIELKD